MWIKYHDIDIGSDALINITGLYIDKSLYDSGDENNKPVFWWRFKNLGAEQFSDIIQDILIANGIKFETVNHEEWTPGMEFGWFETKEQAEQVFKEICEAIAQGKNFFDLTMYK